MVIMVCTGYEEPSPHMQTYSHMLINAAVGKKLEQRGIRPMYWALTIGSFMPDVPLTIMSIGYTVLYEWFGHQSAQEAAFYAFDVLFFEDRLWMASHNLFHAPLMILFYMAIGYGFGFRQNRRWGQWIFWFSLGNLLHTALDIPTHHNDGPLLLFPFNWDVRFFSPVSYWDDAYFAREFTLFEHSIVLMLVVYWIGQWRQQRKAKAPDRTSPAETP